MLIAIEPLRQTRSGSVNHFFALSNPALVSAPAKNSFVSVNSPIFARRSFTSTDAGASGLP
jgi:hypothetical protein